MADLNFSRLAAQIPHPPFLVKILIKWNRIVKDTFIYS